MFSRVRGGKTEWLAAVSETVNGKRTRKYFCAATATEVIALRNEYLVERGKRPTTTSQKEAVLVAAQTVEAFSKEFLAHRKANKKAATHESYEKTLRVHVLPVIGHIPLAHLTAAQVERMYDGIESPSMRKRAHVTLRALLNSAVKRGRLNSSPLATVEAPAYKAKKFEPLSESQVAKLLEASQDSGLERKSRASVH